MFPLSREVRTALSGRFLLLLQACAQADTATSEKQQTREEQLTAEQVVDGYCKRKSPEQMKPLRCTPGALRESSGSFHLPTYAAKSTTVEPPPSAVAWLGRCITS